VLIHKYVGDKLIATWSLARGMQDATCVRACFAALAGLVTHGAGYEREFGTAAQVRASLHCGPLVVVREMGSVRKEIALPGTRSTPRRAWSMSAATAANRSSPRPTFSTGSCFLLALQRGHWASSGCATRNGPSGFARWPRRRLIRASWREEKMDTYARRLCPRQITVPNYMFSGPWRRDIKAGA